MKVTNMTKKDFESLPLRPWNKEVVCSSLIILPTRYKHDSGYRCMDFIACKGDEPLCRLSGCSDVIHLQGIGGYGYNWIDKMGGIPKSISITDINIDCLMKSGLLRIFSRKKILCEPALSSFEIFFLDEEDNRPYTTLEDLKDEDKK